MISHTTFGSKPRLQTAKMNAPQVITRTNFQNLYWSISQQLAHHTVNGCNLQSGDLLASGTISGPTEDSRGCMLELTWRGANPLQLSGGETRQMARRRRSPDDYRLVPRRWLSHRLRRGHRQDSRGLTSNFCNYRNRGAGKQRNGRILNISLKRHVVDNLATNDLESGAETRDELKSD